MADSVSPSASPSSRWPDSRSTPARRSGQWRLRRSIYLAFAVLALALALYGLALLRTGDARATDLQLLAHADEQALRVQRLGGQASLLTAEPGSRRAHLDLLAGLLSEWPPAAAGLDAAARRRTPQHEAPDPLGLALTTWQSRQQRLLQQAQRLLDEGTTAGNAELPAAVAALQAELEPASQALAELRGQLAQAAQARSAELRDLVVWGTAGLLLLLGLLAIAAVEPSVRALGRQLRRLSGATTDVQRLALVAEHTTALVVITDAKDRVQWVNAAFTRVCGWTLAEVRGRKLRQLMAHPREDVLVHARLRAALTKGEGLRHEWLRRARDGRDLWLDIDLRPVTDAAGIVTGFVRVATDVTTRVQQQSKLQALWSALPAGVVVQSESGEIVDANRAAERLLGSSVGELRGLGRHDLRWRVVREDLSEFLLEDQPSMRTLRSGLPLANQSMGVYTPDGSLRWLLVNTEPQRDTQGEVCGVITCFIDITESRQLQEQLQSHARTDTLTQLPNRAVVTERLQRAILHSQRNPGYGFALLFMDFDRFKQVNDTLGHSAGDELLRQIAGRLQVALRPGDAIARVETQHHVAARIGGDEFVVVLDGVDDTDSAGAIAERLLGDLSAPYLIGTTPVQSSASIGLVLYGGMQTPAPPEGPAGVEVQAETLLRNADTAMYEAKRAGRGRWVLFDDSMHERVVRALAVETDLRRAIKEDELFVVYQPVLDLATRTMIGAEALVRWRHPERGLVSPAEFIGVAEECGLIDTVGEIVLRKACGQYVQWQRSLGGAAPRQLAVNLSRAQLKRAALVPDVARILQETGMAVNRLQLEVTESLAAQDERVQTTLRELKSLGVTLALDDFGTGYSSLACLHLLPVDTVKIDRSFVRHAETVEYHRVLIEATIRVARTLGMSTVAEGIETEGQAQLLQRLECDGGQGFLFAKPLEAADLEAWVRASRSAPAALELASA